MKINANTIKVGNCLEHKGQLYTVLKVESIKPGKGGAFAQTELRSLKDGTKINERFRASESVEKVHLEEQVFQFLYKDGECINIMNQATYEQMLLPISLVEDFLPFLEEEMMITICFYGEDVVSVRIPEHVVVTVAETEPVLKGQTVTSSFKPAILENGIRVSVPPHVNVGDKIVVSTLDNSYVERAKVRVF